MPGICIVCNKPSYRELDLCAECQQILPKVASPCSCCGLPLHTGEFNAKLCGTCLNKAPLYTHIISAFDYTEPVNSLISAFKYHDKLSHGRVMTTLLLQHLEHIYQFRSLPELLIPMPLHYKRLRERGYNQALEIARPLSSALQIPVDYRSIYRQRHTLRQEGLNIKQRSSNLHGAFANRQKKSFRLPESLAIVDDVVTTTASTRALCKQLKKLGAKEIHIWSLARACQKK